jgi:hypothetical protein
MLHGLEGLFLRSRVSVGRVGGRLVNYIRGRPRAPSQNADAHQRTKKDQPGAFHGWLSRDSVCNLKTPNSDDDRHIIMAINRDHSLMAWTRNINNLG